MIGSDAQDDVVYILDLLGREGLANERSHGFGESPPSEAIALMHSELSEALEEVRTGKPLNETYYNPDKPTKPEGVPSELADVIIRVVGFCARHNIDIGAAVLEKMAYNESRPYKHGGKAF